MEVFKKEEGDFGWGVYYRRRADDAGRFGRVD